MSWLEDPSLEPDESFGPGTDLVISLFAVLLLLLALAVHALDTPIAKPDGPESPTKILWTLEQRYKEEPLFEQDRAVLTIYAKEQIALELPAIRRVLESDSDNQILVEGYASPESPPNLTRQERERWNLKLSVDRSIAVVDYLYEHGIPYECMSVTGFGRSHSVLLSEWLEKDSARTVPGWDSAGATPVAEAGEKKLAKERIVRILGIRHRSSICGLARRPILRTDLSD